MTGRLRVRAAGASRIRIRIGFGFGFGFRFRFRIGFGFRFRFRAATLRARTAGRVGGLGRSVRAPPNVTRCYARIPIRSPTPKT